MSNKSRILIVEAAKEWSKWMYNIILRKPQAGIAAGVPSRAYYTHCTNNFCGIEFILIAIVLVYDMSLHYIANILR